MSFAAAFKEVAARCADNIHVYCERLERFTPSPQQKELFDLVQLESTLPYRERKRKIAVASGQGPGKTTASTIVSRWRTFRSVNAMCVLTAPTQRQCSTVFLAEFRRGLEKADPYYRTLWNVLETKAIFMNTPQWGVTCVTATKPENAQGLHHPNMTVICEEASGIPRNIQEQFQGTLTNNDALWLQIGNPNTRDCFFFDCFNHMREDWHTLNWNAEETPNHIVDQDHIRKLREQYGRESDFYRVRVLGQFPKADPNCVISSEDVLKCQKTDPYEMMKLGGMSQKQIGIDLARFGSDESTIFVRQGFATIEWRRFVKTEPIDVLDAAFKIQHDLGWKDEDVWYVIDAGGLGGGAIGYAYRHGKRVFEFHFGGAAYDAQYSNKVTEAWFEAGKLLKAGTFYMPKDHLLMQQLSDRIYEMKEQHGITKFCIEPKQRYIDRKRREGGESVQSPDRADGFILSIYNPKGKKGTVMI